MLTLTAAGDGVLDEARKACTMRPSRLHGALLITTAGSTLAWVGASAYAREVDLALQATITVGIVAAPVFSVLGLTAMAHVAGVACVAILAETGCSVVLSHAEGIGATLAPIASVHTGSESPSILDAYLVIFAVLVIVAVRRFAAA